MTSTSFPPTHWINGDCLPFNGSCSTKQNNSQRSPRNNSLADSSNFHHMTVINVFITIIITTLTYAAIII